MARKVIIDCDPGIDDAVALCVALFDPRLEVAAITAAAGNVAADQASRNVQAVIDQLDPPRLPRVGCAPPDIIHPIDRRDLHGDDGLGHTGLEISALHHQHLSEKIIFDELRGSPGDVTIITLGPLTNLARAFQRDPELPSLIDRLIIQGGAVTAPGDVTPTAEFNIYCDPSAARRVFRSGITKTLIPLDVTTQVALTLAQVSELPDESPPVAALIKRMLAFAFRAYHLKLGQESIFVHAAVAIVAALQPELFHTEEMAGDVETIGEVTLGATVFDRRRRPDWRPNMDVALEIDAAAVADSILRSLMRAGRLT